mgnify:CR=1 FL=1
MDPKLLNLNVEIKDLPADTNRILNVISVTEGKFKWMVIRDALMFYADHRRGDFPGLDSPHSGLGGKQRDNEATKRDDRKRNPVTNRRNKEEAELD